MCPVDAVRLLQHLQQNVDRHAGVTLEWMAHRNIVQAARQIAPSQTLQAITEEIVRFQMPGTIVSGFDRKAGQMAQAGIYDRRVEHDDVVIPRVRQWGVVDLEGLDPDGERDREQRADALGALGALEAEAARFQAQRGAAEARRTARQPSTT